MQAAAVRGLGADIEPRPGVAQREWRRARAVASRAPVEGVEQLRDWHVLAGTSQEIGDVMQPLRVPYPAQASREGQRPVFAVAAEGVWGAGGRLLGVLLGRRTEELVDGACGGGRIPGPRSHRVAVEEHEECPRDAGRQLDGTLTRGPT